MDRPHLRQVPLAGLYVVLDAGVARGRDLGEILVQAAAGGARLFQYRDKHASMREAYEAARVLRDLTRTHRSLLIINDRCDLALAVDADGVHLGQGDLPVQAARRLLGPDRLIGLSTHRPAEVEDPSASGADYLGFGPIYATKTKVHHDPAVGVQGMARIRAMTSLPVFAVGGVTRERVAALRRAGADGIAVASAVVTAGDIRSTVQSLIRSFEEGALSTHE